MLFALLCLDKPNSVDLRLANREEHLAYVASTGDVVKLGGPFLAEDGKTMVGSLVVVETETIEGAKDWSAGDPYAKAGLFQSVDIRPWKWTLGNPDLG